METLELLAAGAEAGAALIVQEARLEPVETVAAAMPESHLGKGQIMIYAIVENGIVINTVIAEPDFAAEHACIECPSEAGIGWGYANGVFTAPPVVEPTPAPAPTKEQLLAQLQALQAQIQALE